MFLFCLPIHLCSLWLQVSDFISISLGTPEEDEESQTPGALPSVVSSTPSASLAESRLSCQDVACAYTRALLQSVFCVICKSEKVMKMACFNIKCYYQGYPGCEVCARSAPHVISCFHVCAWSVMQGGLVGDFKDCSSRPAQGVGDGVFPWDLPARCLATLGRLPSFRPQDYLWVRSWPPADVKYPQPCALSLEAWWAATSPSSVWRSVSAIFT